MRIDSIQTTIRNRLAREVREYGVRAMADRIGWYHANISNWLTGKHPIPMERAQSICEVLGLMMTIEATVTFEEVEWKTNETEPKTPAKAAPKRQTIKRQPVSPTGPTAKSRKRQRRA